MHEEQENENDAQTTQAVEAGLAKLRRKHRRREYTFWNFIGVVLAFPFLVAILTTILFRHNSSLFRQLVSSASIFSLVAIAFAIWGRLWFSPKFNVEQIVKAGGVEAIPTLFSAFQNPLFPLSHKAAHDALTNLLPQMKSSDAYLLTPASRQTINSWLNSVNNDKILWPSFFTTESTICRITNSLLLASLKALEQVGDASAIPAVERLANMETQSADLLKIKQAANDCLPLLRANCGLVEANKTLLRASQPETADPQTLLRPASGGNETPPYELVRASGSEGDGTGEDRG